MNTVTVHGDKRMTLKEVAEATGASYRTIAAYVQKAGWTQNGKQTLLDERQVTVILEAIKNKAENGVGEAAKLASVLQGVETSQSLDFQLVLIERQAHELWKRKALEQEGRAVRAEQQLQATQHLLTERETGLSAIQRIAEAGTHALRLGRCPCDLQEEIGMISGIKLWVLSDIAGKHKHTNADNDQRDTNRKLKKHILPSYPISDYVNNGQNAKQSNNGCAKFKDSCDNTFRLFLNSQHFIKGCAYMLQSFAICFVHAVNIDSISLWNHFQAFSFGFYSKNLQRGWYKFWTVLTKPFRKNPFYSVGTVSVLFLCQLINSFHDFWSYPHTNILTTHIFIVGLCFTIFYNFSVLYIDNRERRSA